MIKNSKKAGVGSLLSQLQNNMSLIIFALLLYISTLQNHLSHSKIWMALKIVVSLQWILEQKLLQKKVTENYTYYAKNCSIHYYLMCAVCVCNV